MNDKCQVLSVKFKNGGAVLLLKEQNLEYWNGGMMGKEFTRYGLGVNPIRFVSYDSRLEGMCSDAAAQRTKVRGSR
jgi:hypothetical protein